MRNQIEIFKNREFGNLRVVNINNEPWFVAKDVCDVLDIKNPTKALQRLEFDERSNFKLGRQGSVNIINEYGLYSLILGSKKKEAKHFKRWVTHEVIPTIRKTGSYQIQQKAIPQSYKEALIELVAVEEEKEKLQLTLNEQQPKVLFADSVSASGNTILIGELAKLIQQNGYEIGQNRLFEWMRENGYLIRKYGSDYNMPTQYSMERGLFKIKETTITHSSGNITTSRTVKVTGKGQLYFINKFLKMEDL